MPNPTKHVILRIGQGSFEQGFDVNLRISVSGVTTIEMDGALSPEPQLRQLYDELRQSYQRYCFLNYSGFRAIEMIDDEATNISLRHVSTDLCLCLDQWLEHSPHFQRIRDELLYSLSGTDTIRFMIRTADPVLQWLPWHQCRLFERYINGACALNFAARSQAVTLQDLKNKVRVLPVLGDDTGLDIHTDLKLLQDKLPKSAEILPAQMSATLATLGEALWEQHPDILFFAGHSSSRGEEGIFKLSESKSVTIAQLKNALRKAIAHGLKLVIFNSCDGLKLAADLADLNLPAIIVMRERIPDLAAQHFLDSFLTAFADPRDLKPLSLAVREAQDRLKHLEDEFPCVSWLPVLCQHPESPDPTWQDLRKPTPNPIQRLGQQSQQFVSTEFFPKIQTYRWQILGTFSLSFFMLFFVGRPMLAQRFVELSVQCHDAKKPLCAQTWLKRALLLDPNNASAKSNWNYFAELYDLPLQYDDLPEGSVECNLQAVHLIQEQAESKAVSLLHRCELMLREEYDSPHDLSLMGYTINKNLAWAHYEQNNPRQAKHHARKALEQKKDGAAAHCLLAILEHISQSDTLQSFTYCKEGANKEHSEELLWLKIAQSRFSKLATNSNYQAVTE